MNSRRSHQLLVLGFVLFLLGLLTGFAVPLLVNPRMGLASHLEGLMNGMFLIGLGLVWPRVRLGPAASATAFWLALYGTVANWGTTLMAAWWGAGASMPIAAGPHRGTPPQELLIDVLLYSLSLAMVAVCLLVLWGLLSGPSSQLSNEESTAGPAVP